jgi:O-antigen/teichoic acid export membrane protein
MSPSKASPGLNRQAFWLIVARGAGFIFLLALPIVMVRVFDKSQFGVYKQVFVVVGTATGVCSFGFALTAFYYLPRLPEKRGAVIFNIVLYYALSGLFAFAVFGLWPGILKLILGKEGLEHYSPLIGAIICTWVFSSFLESVATAHLDVAWSTLFIIGAQISKTALLICMAAVFRTVNAVLYGALAQGVLQSVVLLWYLQMRFPSYWRQFDRSIAMDQLRYAAPFGVYGLLYSVQTDLHNYLVANRFSTAAFAIYAVGTAQLPFAGILRDSLNSVLLPRVSRLQQQRKPEEILDLMIRAWRKLSAALLPACALLLVLGRDFITAMYTASYLASWPIFELNLSLLVLAIFLTDAVIRTHAESRFFFLQLRMVTVVIQVPASILAMNMFGMIGALMGVLFVSAFEQAVSLFVVLRMLGFGRRHIKKLSGLAGFAAASAVAGLVTWAARSWVPVSSPKLILVFGCILFGLVYACAVVALQLPVQEEREMVNRYSLKFLRVRLLGEGA